MRYSKALLFLTILGACSERTSEKSPGDSLQAETASPGEYDGELAISFYVHPLFVPDGGSDQHAASVWSQNDYRDSVTVVIAGADGFVLRELSIDLSGRIQVEGDATVDPELLASKAMRWMTLSDVRVDTLPSIPVGRRLLTVRPYTLWDDYATMAGDGMAVDSLHLTIHVTDGRTFETGLVLLWD